MELRRRIWDHWDTLQSPIKSHTPIKSTHKSFQHYTIPLLRRCSGVVVALLLGCSWRCGIPLVVEGGQGQECFGHVVRCCRQIRPESRQGPVEVCRQTIRFLPKTYGCLRPTKNNQWVNEHRSHWIRFYFLHFWFIIQSSYLVACCCGVDFHSHSHGPPWRRWFP